MGIGHVRSSASNPLPGAHIPIKYGKPLTMPLSKHTGKLLSEIIKSSFMSDLDIQIPTAFDPFTEANADDSGAGSKEYVHIRVQQRNGRKSLTTVQGLKKEFSYNKILKDLKKEFCCNGTVVQDPELGQVIQLQGDQRKNVSTFLVQAGIVKKEHIKIHGF
ncbi:SUI1 domain [Dillenia turbinata]|uniref:SUI1 domain n=1 Tax=Dillenia turbinata TaxID=194707 RepID=A0AAN8W6G3_9MAGN